MMKPARRYLCVLLSLALLMSVCGSAFSEGQSVFAQVQSKQEEVNPYTWMRDAFGNLALDENGNPKVIVAEGAEIPVAFARDAAGNLILDANGDPVPTYTVPANAQLMVTLNDAGNADRAIDIYAAWQEEEPVMGGHVLFVAVLWGYDNLTFTVTWQQSPDDNTWSDIEIEYPEDVTLKDMLRYLVEITPENYDNYWRVKITITGATG